MKWLIIIIVALWLFVAWTLLRASSLCSRQEERELGILMDNPDDKKEK